MANGAMSTSTHANFLPELWIARTIDAFDKELVLAKVLDDWSGEFADGGKTVHIPVFKNLTTADIQDETEAQGATYTPQLTDDDAITLEIDQFKYVSVEITRRLRDYNRPDLVTKWAGKLGYPLGAHFDQWLAEQAVAASANDAVDLTGAIDDEAILLALKNAKKLMDLHDVPGSERYFVFGPELYNRLLIADKIGSIDYADTKTLPEGALGRLLGVPVFMSNNLATTAASGATIKHNLLVWREAFAYAVPRESGMTVMIREGDAHFVNTQLTARMDFGGVSVPRNGSDNYGIVVINTDENL